MNQLLEHPVPVWALIALASIWTVYFIGKQILVASAPTIKKHPYWTLWIIGGLCTGFAAANQAARVSGEPAVIVQVQGLLGGVGIVLLCGLALRALNQFIDFP